MNKAQLKNLNGHCVRLQPAARGSQDEERDDDWVVHVAGYDAVQLVNARTGESVVLGSDHIFSYFTDAARTTTTTQFGFLQLHSQVRMLDGNATVEPLAPPRARGDSPPRLAPLIVRDGMTDRHFSWRGRDPVHLLTEDEPRQLGNFFVTLCDALRIETDNEPEFHLARDIRGEIVYEISPDHRSRSRLLGGMGGRPAPHVLVLTDRPARAVSTAVEANVPSDTKVVRSDYPSTSGLQARLEAEGYRVRWVRDDQIQRRQGEGWEGVVIEEIGAKVILKISGNGVDVDSTLMKRK